MTEMLQYLGALYLGLDLSTKVAIPLLLAGLVCGLVARLGGEEYLRFRLGSRLFISAGLLALFWPVIIWLLTWLAESVIDAIVWLLVLLGSALLDSLKDLLLRFGDFFKGLALTAKIGVFTLVAGVICRLASRLDEENQSRFRVPAILLTSTGVIILLAHVIARLVAWLQELAAKLQMFFG